MIKRIFTIIGTAIFIFSCNNAAEKTKDKKENRLTLVTKDEYDDQLVNLDTAENMYNLLCQGWEMEDDVDALAGMDDNSTLVIPFRSFYFSADGSFIKNPRNAMEYGDWHYDDAKKTITLNYQGGGGKDIYKIAALASDELQLLNKGINTSTIIKFISSGKRFKKAADEPFYIGNNRWRISPLKKESDSAIRRRLKDQLHFFILFHKSTIVKNDRQVSFWGLPSCFTWYGGAIYMKGKEKLDDWIDCFYNKAQAMKAYALAEKLMEKKYEWPRGESNWLKQNLAVLEQMYKYIDEVK